MGPHWNVTRWATRATSATTFYLGNLGQPYILSSNPVKSARISGRGDRSNSKTFRPFFRSIFNEWKKNFFRRKIYSIGLNYLHCIRVYIVPLSVLVKNIRRKEGYYYIRKRERKNARHLSLSFPMEGKRFLLASTRKTSRGKRQWKSETRS